jgi:hypothetical protein
MIELDEEVFDVALHANVTAFVDVVPFDVDPSKFIPCHVALNSVVFFEDIQQVVEVFKANILHTKIVYKEAKLDWTPFVAPQS